MFDRHFSSGRSEIGLLLFSFSLSPSLGIGITSAIFHSEGKVHVSIEQLTIEVIVRRIGARQSLITRIGILSIPGDLWETIDATMPSICLQESPC